MDKLSSTIVSGLLLLLAPMAYASAQELPGGTLQIWRVTEPCNARPCVTYRVLAAGDTESVAVHAVDTYSFAGHASDLAALERGEALLLVEGELVAETPGSVGTMFRLRAIRGSHAPTDARQGAAAQGWNGSLDDDTRPASVSSAPAARGGSAGYGAGTAR